MHPTIEAHKAQALQQIRANWPQKDGTGNYVCQFCGDRGADRGWQLWHTCAPRAKQGIRIRIVR